MTGNVPAFPVFHVYSCDSCSLLHRQTLFRGYTYIFSFHAITYITQSGQYAQYIRYGFLLYDSIVMYTIPQILLKIDSHIVPPLQIFTDGS